jgi:hypothetical protein
MMRYSGAAFRDRFSVSVASPGATRPPDSDLHDPGSLGSEALGPRPKQRDYADATAGCLSLGYSIGTSVGLSRRSAPVEWSGATYASDGKQRSLTDVNVAATFLLRYLPMSTKGTSYAPVHRDNP